MSRNSEAATTTITRANTISAWAIISCDSFLIARGDGEPSQAGRQYCTNGQTTQGAIMATINFVGVAVSLVPTDRPLTYRCRQPEQLSALVSSPHSRVGDAT